MLRARAAKLDPGMRIDTFTSDSGVTFDRELWNELCSLRFLDEARGALILGPLLDITLMPGIVGTPCVWQP
ncbi:MAG: ATP-binding protein [Pseudonocardiales bacterium]|nr:ATP-binding protein [Pseudonocardiales bacterium]